MQSWQQILAGIVLVLGGTATVVLAPKVRHDSQPEPITSDQAPALDRTMSVPQNDLASQYSNGQCVGSGSVKLTHMPMNIDDVSIYEPYGLMVGAHITPIDHGYFAPADPNSARDAYPVFAVADGTIVDVSHRASFPDGSEGNRQTDEYRLFIEHTCTFYTYVDLVTSLAPELQAKLSQYGQADSWYDSVRISIAAGQQLGRIGGQTLDFGVYNAEHVLTGFISQDLYEREFWKKYTDDPFKYFVEPIRSELLAKDIRTAKPRSGKIDYDQPGKLVGNWFVKGTNGYAGNQQQYWRTHLAFAYDAIDPTQVRISIGDARFAGGPFGVHGNEPDPATVTADSGPTSYLLTDYEYVKADTGESVGRSVMEPGSYQAKNSRGIRGAVLVEVLPNEELEVQFFPDATSADGLAFTGDAMLYER